MAKSLVAEKVQKFVTAYVDAIALKIYSYINERFDKLVKQVIMPLEDASSIVQEHIEGMQEVYSVTSNNLALRVEGLLMYMQKEGMLDAAKLNSAFIDSARVRDQMMQLLDLPFVERVQKWQEWNATQAEYMRISRHDMQFAKELQNKELQLTPEERIAYANQLELGTAFVEKLQSEFSVAVESA